MRRFLILAYGLSSYLIFLASFLYAVGFVGNLVVPKSLDSGPRGPLPVALLIDSLLLALFAVPHSVMARPSFKRWWTTIIPPSIERSTYVLVSSISLSILFWTWRPITNVVWQVENWVPRLLIQVVFFAGWMIALTSTFLIDHFDLFGLRQVYDYSSGRPSASIAFKTPGLYRYLRHPLMLGFLLAFWAAPTMTAGHLLFAGATTAYILIALRLEERDLVNSLGERYRAYQQQTRMLLPIPQSRPRGTAREGRGTSG